VRPSDGSVGDSRIITQAGSVPPVRSICSISVSYDRLELPAGGPVVRVRQVACTRDEAKVAPLSKDISNVTVNYSRGKIVRVSPPDQGPFRISLKVTDDVGMTRVSDPVDIPADQNYVPISNVYAGSSQNLLNQSVVNVTVKDINGKPVPGVIVNFAFGSNPFNNLTFGPYFSVTDSEGNATTVTAGIGTIKAIYGKFPVMEVPVGI